MRVFDCKEVDVRRDLDLIREILLKVEADPKLDGTHYSIPDSSDFPGHTDEEIAYHVGLLIQAGLLKQAAAGQKVSSVAITQLTWSGHEFLAKTRDVGVWNKVKQRLGGLPDVALSVIAALAEAELKKLLGLDGTGLTGSKK